LGVAPLELRAPQHHVEVIGDGREIAIDRRRSPDILRLHVALLQPRDQRLRIIGQDTGLHGGEKVDALTGKSDHIRKDLTYSALNAAQEIRKVGTDGFL
jgi:hypothetical protein